MINSITGGRVRFIIWSAAVLNLVAITIVAATNLLIIRAGEAHVAASVGEVPKSQAAIILGAKVFEDNILSNVLADR